MHRFERIIERIAAALLGTVAVVTVVEVVLRQAFDTRLPDAYTLAGFLQAIAVMWGIAVAVLAGRHIAVDILWEVSTPVSRRRIDLIATAACIVFFAALTLMIGAKVGRVYASGEGTLELTWPVWPMYLLGMAGSAFALVSAVIRLRKIARGEA